MSVITYYNTAFHFVVNVKWCKTINEKNNTNTVLCFIQMRTPLFLLSFLMMSNALRHPLFRSSFYTRFHTSARSSVELSAIRKGDDSGSGYKLKSLAPSYVPKTPNQKEYLRYLVDPDVSIVLGVVGGYVVGRRIKAKGAL